MGNNAHVAKPKAGALHLEWSIGRGWFVKDEYSRNLAGPFQCENKALMSLEARQRAADLAAKRGPRSCMRCKAEFMSEGIHHRLCGRCRHCDASDDPVRPYITRGRSA